MELNERLAEMTARCQAKFEENQNERFLGNICHAELAEMRALAERLREAGPEALLRQLREEQAALEAELEREQYSPSFDWYDDHYHEECLIGKLDARRAVTALLEETQQRCGEPFGSAQKGQK